MGTILSFPQERREPAEDFSFVNDGETLDFEADGADIQLDCTAAELDWNNQELADLYRVKHLLDQAGITSETDRGVSDEGDPWFVFMNADGEVFIHFCRIDRMYYLDSPNLDTALRGHDARALVADYTSKVMGRGNSGYDPKTVVRLGTGGGGVSLHPAVMIAALVWSLFIGAEDAISLPALGTSDTPEPQPEPMEAEIQHPAPKDGVRDIAQSAMAAEDGAITATSQAETQHLRDSMGGSNGYAAGLSAIAIGIGVLTDHGLDLLEDTSLEQIFHYLSASAGVADPSAEETDPSAPSSAAASKALDVLIKITQMPSGPDMLLAGATAVDNGPQGAEDLTTSVEQALISTTDGTHPLPAQPTVAALENVPAFDASDSERRETGSHASDGAKTPAAVLQASPVSTPDQTLITQSTSTVSAAASYGSGLVLSEIRIGESIFLASFKVTEKLLDKFDVTDGLLAGAMGTQIEPDLPEEGLHAGSQFDILRALDEMGNDDARDTIQSLIARQTDLEIANNGSWLWIVEADAQYAPLDQTISKIFESDDGDRVMITGMKTTFTDADADIGIG